jgi:hypothetical protein
MKNKKANAQRKKKYSMNSPGSHSRRIITGKKKKARLLLISNNEDNRLGESTELSIEKENEAVNEAVNDNDVEMQLLMKLRIIVQLIRFSRAC